MQDLIPIYENSGIYDIKIINQKNTIISNEI